MTDRETIRAEIERRMKCFKNERNTITKASDNNLSLGARIAMCEEILSFINSLQEEPISKEIGNYDHKAVMEALHPELKEEPVSEELEEAADEYAPDFSNSIASKAAVNAVREAFKTGANYQKEQMMAKAIETTFNVSLPSGLYDKLWIKGCKEDDKLLVIKKDEL